MVKKAKKAKRKKRKPEWIRYVLPVLVVAVLIAVRPVPVSHEKLPAPVPVVNHIHKLFLKYEVYAATFKSLNSSLKMEIDNKNYSVELEATTEGFIGKLFPWKTSTRTTGRVSEKGALIPTLHTETSTWRKNVSVTETHYDAQGKAMKMTVQDNDKPPVSIDMDNKLTAHAADVLTGMVALLQNAGNTHKCTGSSTVFDGKRRFDITLTDDGKEMLVPSKYAHFEGEAMRCILKVVPGDGFQPKDLKRGWMVIQNYTESRNKLPTLWLAKTKDSDDQTVVVRMEIASAYGSAVANISGN